MDQWCCEERLGSGDCGCGVWRLVVCMEEWRIEDGGTTQETSILRGDFGLDLGCHLSVGFFLPVPNIYFLLFG